MTQPTLAERDIYDFTLEIDMIAPDGSVYMDGIFIDDNTATAPFKTYEIPAELPRPEDLPF